MRKRRRVWQLAVIGHVRGSVLLRDGTQMPRDLRPRPRLTRRKREPAEYRKYLPLTVRQIYHQLIERDQEPAGRLAR
jgi:hypothetical protein